MPDPNGPVKDAAQEPRKSAEEQATQEESQEQERKVAASLLVRAVFLIALVAAVEFWLNRHLGISFGNPGTLGQWTAFISVGTAFLGWLLKKSEWEQLAELPRRWLNSLLSIPLLAILALVALLLGFSYSSLVIVTDPGQSVRVISFAPIDMQGVEADGIQPLSAGGKGAPQRFLVRTTLFGRTFRLKVSGYLPATFDIQPFLGRQIRPSRDLQVSPSLLLRPPNVALGMLEDGFFVLRKEGQEEPLACVQGESSSFLIGHPQRIPADYFEGWGLELMGVIGPDQQKVSARILRKWYSPHVIKPESDLEPGMNLVAEVHSQAAGSCENLQAGFVVARTEITLGTQALTDVAMREAIQ